MNMRKYPALFFVLLILFMPLSIADGNDGKNSAGTTNDGRGNGDVGGPSTIGSFLSDFVEGAKALGAALYDATFGKLSRAFDGELTTRDIGETITSTGVSTALGKVGMGIAKATPIGFVVSFLAWLGWDAMQDQDNKDRGDLGKGERDEMTDESEDTSGDGPSGCFTGDQLVLTTNGELQIQFLKSGDTVISYDNKKDIFTTSLIGDIIIHDGMDSLMNNFDKYPLVELSVKVNGKIVKTNVTNNHPYFNPVSGKYEKLRDFSEGDLLKTINGDGIIMNMENLIEVSSSIEEKSTVVYNLEINQGPPTYIVNGVVVHDSYLATLVGKLRNFAPLI